MVGQLPLEQLIGVQIPVPEQNTKDCGYNHSLLYLFWKQGFELERGRENSSFPMAEVLKPRGFKAQAVRPSSSNPHCVKSKLSSPT